MAPQRPTAAQLFTRLTFSRSKHPALADRIDLYISTSRDGLGERQTEIADDDTRHRSGGFVSKIVERSSYRDI